MMGWPVDLDARSWLDRLLRGYARRIRLGDIPDEALAPILATGCDMVWLLGVWRTGAARRNVARSLPLLETEARAILPEFTPVWARTRTNVPAPAILAPDDQGKRPRTAT